MILSNITGKKIYLASKSPRRRELLKNFGFDFEIFDSDTSEDIESNGDPAEFVVKLALKKAEYPVERIQDGIIITADTIVYLDGNILEKPTDKDDAYRMISLLQGKTHQVYTGIAASTVPENIVRTGFEATDVTFKEMKDEEIAWYIDSGEYEDKAGAYAIQGGASLFVKKINGCYFNVVGLPIHKLYSILNEVNQLIH